MKKLENLQHMEKVINKTNEYISYVTTLVFFVVTTHKRLHQQSFRQLFEWMISQGTQPRIN